MVLYSIKPITKLEETQVEANNPMSAVKDLFSDKIKFQVENVESGKSWIIGLYEIKIRYE